MNWLKNQKEQKMKAFVAEARYASIAEAALKRTVVKVETLEEFLKRGGRIKKIPQKK